MHGHVNTNRDWMRQRECAAQQQGNKNSILMNVPTRQCLRKSKRDKTEPSLQNTKCRHENKRTGVLRKTQNRGGILPPLLGLQPRAFGQGCKPHTTHYLCCRRFAAIDPNRRQLVNLPRKFSKLVRLQDTVLVPFCTTSSS